MRHALHQAMKCQRKDLTLAVDSNNAPALQLYYRHGMRRVGSRIAMVRDLREQRSRAPVVNNNIDA
jgi:ribosomal protein S18 acetylase RimI-like enzyme